VRPYRETWRGFFLARDAWRAPKGLDLVWRRIPQSTGEDACQLHEFAGRGDEAEREVLHKALVRGAGGEAVRYEDPATGGVREAFLTGGRLERVVFLTASGRLPPRDWLAELFIVQALSATDRAALLIGRAPGAAMESGPPVCACRNVRAGRIEAAIAAGAASVDAVSEVTTAGTVCGSCRPEIARLIAAHAKKEVRHAA
jgi:assimilatory nitrate reductase catalytic subunit